MNTSTVYIYINSIRIFILPFDWNIFCVDANRSSNDNEKINPPYRYFSLEGAATLFGV